MWGVQTRPAVLSSRRLCVPESLCCPSHVRLDGIPLACGWVTGARRCMLLRVQVCLEIYVCV